MSEILSTPTQGYRYKVISGDRLYKISLSAYGVPERWPDIVAANSFLASRPPVIDGSPTIYPDDILIIPKETTGVRAAQSEKKLSGKDTEDFTIVINDREIIYDSTSFLSTMDTMADAVNCEMPWIPGLDKDFDKSLLPFAYPKSEIFIGNELYLTGKLYTVSPSLQDRSNLNLVIYSNTIDAVDSNVIPPYEKNNITLDDRALQLLQPLGINALFLDDTGGAFDRVTARPTEKIFNHLADLASQRGLLLSCNNKGEAIFYKADTESEPVGTLREGENFALSFSNTFDGRKLFNTYKCIADTPGGDAQTASVVDNNIPISRTMTFTADSTTDGNIQKACEWKRSRSYSDALSFPLPVVGWLAPNGTIWKRNTSIIVESPTLFIPNGAKFMIKHVELSLNNSGRTAILSLVPPQAFTGEEIPYVWSVE